MSTVEVVKRDRIKTHYQVIRIVPASMLFQHEEYREIVSRHKTKIGAWLSCYIWNHCKWLPTYIERIAEEVGK